MNRRGDAKPKLIVNPAVIVMDHPTIEKILEMTLPQRDQEIQALSTNPSDQGLANGIRLR